MEARKIKFELQFFSKEFFAVSVEEGFGASTIEDLGGTIKIGEVKAKFQTQIVKEAFLQKSKQAQSQITESLASSGSVDEMAKSAEKIFFGISVYCTEKTLRPLSGVIQRFVGSAVKGELAGYGKKSKFMGFSKDRKFAQLSHVEVLKKNLVENKAEILLCIGKEETWVATTVAVHNPFEFQKRDIYKPNQRKIFAMPPRIARIMVNLSSCTPEKVLLDPFCGVGTILQEALLARAKVVGVDVNPWCVKAANENLEWLKREYSLEGTEFRVLQGDVSRLAQKIGQETVDCIVTEPDLGPALRQVPTGPYALKIIQKLEPLYFGFVEEAHRVLKRDGRLVLVTPYINTRSGKSVTMSIGEKLENCGFKRVQPLTKEMFSEGAVGLEELVGVSSLVEVDERHKIGREIHIYEK
ncbi:methyltransferase domain-containing protein [Candidatus Bathyarchaeota archaeon]|nr:methyltransferase domain-containing protein [Candidatus Bathyarchaeota archaeon]